jgi:probable phosphoglycerate mutase
LVGHGSVMDVLHRATTRQDLQAARTSELGNAAISRRLWSSPGFVLLGWGAVG